MELKYLLLSIGLLSLLLEKFVRTKNNENPEYKNYTSYGHVIFIIIPILSIVLAIISSINDDNKAKTKELVLLQKQHDDSITFLNRWQFDTTRLKQILDSSEKIISNSNENLSKTNSSLITARNLLNLQNQQIGISKEGLNNTKDLFYIIPTDVGFRFCIQFKLDSEMNSLVRYLDSFFVLKYGLYSNTKFFSFKSYDCRDLNFFKIKSFCESLIDPQINFSIGDSTVLAISYNSDFFDQWHDNKTRKIMREMNHTFMRKQNEDFVNQCNFIYTPSEKILMFTMPYNFFLPLQVETPYKNRGLNNIDNKTISLMLNKCDFNSSIIKIKSISLRLLNDDVLYLPDLIQVENNKVPKNYSDIENELLLFQKKVNISSDIKNAFASQILEQAVPTNEEMQDEP